jgi:hypothetical protein
VGFSAIVRIFLNLENSSRNTRPYLSVSAIVDLIVCLHSCQWFEIMLEKNLPYGESVQKKNSDQVDDTFEPGKGNALKRELLELQKDELKLQLEQLEAEKAKIEVEHLKAELEHKREINKIARKQDEQRIRKSSIELGVASFISVVSFLSGLVFMSNGNPAGHYLLGIGLGSTTAAAIARSNGKDGHLDQSKLPPVAQNAEPEN